MAKKNNKRSTLDPGVADDGVYEDYEEGHFDDSDYEGKEEIDDTPRTMRKSAAGRSLKRWSRECIAFRAKVPDQSDARLLTLMLL